MMLNADKGTSSIAVSVILTNLCVVLGSVVTPTCGSVTTLGPIGKTVRPILREGSPSK